MTNETIHCPLCGALSAARFSADQARTYLRCGGCDMVFVPPAERLAAEAEKSRYDQHENVPEDGGYRNFLARLFNPVNARLATGSRGLDFGCGPGPTLHRMFEEAGHGMRIYDPFYAKDATVFDKMFDFITASEVAEHLFFPGREFERLWGCLKPGGVLGVMTKFVPVGVDFAAWHYRNDDTHVCFYSARTFGVMAAEWNATLDLLHGEVAIFTKPMGG